jgi:hypothetical protein
VCVCVCVCVHVFVTCGNECVCGWSSECFPVHVCVPVRPRIRVGLGHFHSPNGFGEVGVCWPILKLHRAWKRVEVEETSYGDPPAFSFVCAWACACVGGRAHKRAHAARGTCVVCIPRPTLRSTRFLSGSPPDMRIHAERERERECVCVRVCVCVGPVETTHPDDMVRPLVRSYAACERRICLPPTSSVPAEWGQNLTNARTRVCVCVRACVCHLWQ